MSALTKQIDGDHYKSLKIQPLQLSYMIAGGDSCFTKLVKYTTRKKDNPALQYEKAIHIVGLSQEVRENPYKPLWDETKSNLFILNEFCNQFEPEVADHLRAIYSYFLNGNHGATSRNLHRSKVKEILCRQMTK